MRKSLWIIIALILIAIIYCLSIWYYNNNLRFISESDKTKLMNILDITEANSFEPIYRKYSSGLHGSDPNVYEVKFEISIEDFEKNDLVYYEEPYEVLVDCHYKEKKDNTTYTCIVKASDIQNEELFNKIRNYKNIDIMHEEINSNTNNYNYKHFTISYENGFDLVKNMEYKDKIYHLVLDNYEDYLKFKNNNNDVYNMTEKSFENNFMVITAIENTSMLGLTLSSFYNSENDLIIELNSFEEGTEYDEKKNAISIVIPRDLKKDNILVKDVRNKNNNDYGWENTSIRGLTKITEEQAIETSKKYAEQLKNSNSLTGKYLNNYTKVFGVALTKCKPNNYWLITEGIIERNLVTADFEREAYEVILVSEDDEMQVERAFFYIDAYTNSVIAGREMAD